MTNIAKMTALVAFFGLSAAGTAAAAGTATGTCPALAWVTIEGEQVQLPADVAENIAVLQGYGARYARAIRLIVEENARPEWTFGEDCAVADAQRVSSND